MAQGPSNRGRGTPPNQGSGGSRAVATRQQQQGAEPAVRARPGKVSILDTMAARLNMDPMDLQRTLMATVFQKAGPYEFAALLVVAEAYKLNPLTKEIYAFPQKGGGIVPLVSIDGWIRIINEHPQFAGIEWEDLTDADDKLYAIECTIWRKDRTRPVKIIEYLAECKQNTDPWKNMPARMLRHKATIQCGRYAFGFSGIYDAGEVDMLPANAVLVSDIGVGGAAPLPPMREEPVREPTREIPPEDQGRADPATGEVVDDEPTPPDHPSWKRAGEIADDLTDVANIIDLGTFRARYETDIEAMPEDVRDVINTKIEEHEQKLRGGAK